MERSVQEASRGHFWREGEKEGDNKRVREGDGESDNRASRGI